MSVAASALGGIKWISGAAPTDAVDRVCREGDALIWGER